MTSPKPTSIELVFTLVPHYNHYVTQTIRSQVFEIIDFIQEVTAMLDDRSAVNLFQSCKETRSLYHHYVTKFPYGTDQVFNSRPTITPIWPEFKQVTVLGQEASDALSKLRLVPEFTSTVKDMYVVNDDLKLLPGHFPNLVRISTANPPPNPFDELKSDAPSIFADMDEKFVANLQDLALYNPSSNSISDPKLKGSQLTHFECGEFLQDYLNEVPISYYPILLYSLPSTLLTLDLRCTVMNEPLDDMKHCVNLRELYLPDTFDREIDGILTDNLQLLCLGISFDQSLDRLPVGLRELIIMCNKRNNRLCNFNRSLTRLPLGLEKIRIDAVFDQSIDYFPDGIEQIVINGNFNQPIGRTPVDLISLSLGNKFNQPLSKQNLGSSLRNLTLGTSFDQPINDLPRITELKIGMIYGLNVSGNFNQSIDGLVDTIQVLGIFGQFDRPVTKFPSDLVDLYFSNQFNSAISFPPTLRSLHLGTKFNQLITSYPDLHTLQFSGDYNRPLTNLPVSLRTLVLSSSYTQPISDAITNLTKLHTLKLGISQTERLVAIPKTLECLVMFSKIFRILPNGELQYPNFLHLGQTVSIEKKLINSSNGKIRVRLNGYHI